MKILFINLPFSGHIIPTLGLVRELVKRNIKITYLSTSDWEEKVLYTGAEFSEYQDNKKLSVQMKNAYYAAIKLVSDYDLVIYEQFFFLGKHVAEKFNKPAVRIFTSLASNELIMQEFIDAGGMFGIFRSKWICRQWTKEVAKGIDLKTDCWLKEILYNPPELNLALIISWIVLNVDFPAFSKYLLVTCHLPVKFYCATYCPIKYPLHLNLMSRIFFFQVIPLFSQGNPN